MSSIKLNKSILKGSPIGICSHLSARHKHLVLKHVKRLGYYSGSREFPIAHPTDLVGPKLAYMQAPENLFNPNCAYCQRRIEVAHAIIEELDNNEAI